MLTSTAASCMSFWNIYAAERNRVFFSNFLCWKKKEWLIKIQRDEGPQFKVSKVFSESIVEKSMKQEV